MNHVLNEAQMPTVAAGRRRGACAPGGTVQGAAFGGAKIWNSESEKNGQFA